MTKANQQTVKIVNMHIAAGNKEAAQRVFSAALRSAATTKAANELKQAFGL